MCTRHTCKRQGSTCITTNMYCSLLLYCTPLHTTYCTTFRHWQTDVSAHDGRERRHQEGSPVACVLPDAETCRLSAHPPACVRSSCGRMPRGCRSSWKWRWPLASVHRVLPTLRQCTSGRAPSAGGGGGPSRERVCAAGSAVNADQPPLALRSVKSGRSRTRQTPTEGAAPHWFGLSGRSMVPSMASVMFHVPGRVQHVETLQYLGAHVCRRSL